MVHENREALCRILEENRTNVRKKYSREYDKNNYILYYIFIVKNGERHLLTFPKSNLFESQKWQIAQISISQDLLIVK